MQKYVKIKGAHREVAVLSFKDYAALTGKSKEQYEKELCKRWFKPVDEMNVSEIKEYLIYLQSRGLKAQYKSSDTKNDLINLANSLRYIS